DFGAMCQERDAEEVKGVLPYWPRIYCKISVDHDRRIREATQQAFEQLVLKVRRSLAPFLKSLMGHWILSQCDTYTPAASSACQAFQAAFSPAKQPEALGFCKDEILNLLPLIEKAIRNISLQNGPLFLLVTEMLISWEKRAGLHGEGEENNSKDVFKRLLADFWEGLGLLCVCFVDDEDVDPQALEGVATLLQVEGVEKASQIVSEPVNEKAFGSLQTQHFEDAVCQLAQLCLVHVNEKNSEKHLVFLDVKWTDERNPAVEFLLKRVVVWLAEMGRSDTEHLVEMVFSSLSCCSQEETTQILNHVTTWVKSPLLSNRHRGVCEKPSKDMWKFRDSSRLPAHLCVCAVLGRVAQTAAVLPCGQKEALCPSFFLNLTGTVSELLYAMQWCKELDYRPTVASAYRNLLAEWGLSDGLHSKVPMKSLLETLYSRCLWLSGSAAVLSKHQRSRRRGEAFPEPDDPVFPMAVLQSVGLALTYIPVQQLNQNSLPPLFIANQKTNLPESLQTLLNTLYLNVMEKAITISLMMTEMSHVSSLMAILSTCEELCDSILAAVQVGEFAVVQPLSMEYSCILAYLLAWKLLLTFFKSSPSHLRAHYAQYLKRNCSLNKLLLHLFKLMPENPICPGQGTETKESKTFFTESLLLTVDKIVGVDWELPHLACSVYYSTVQDLPAMV
ncbi:hypothetical protein XENOCAPTIV_018350, partial [Xenoophorus captivus]